MEKYFLKDNISKDNIYETIIEWEQVLQLIFNNLENFSKLLQKSCKIQTFNNFIIL